LLTHESRPVRRQRVLVQTADDQMMLLDLDGGMYFALNDVGARVWELCDGTRTVAEISSLLANEYDAPATMIDDDVLELLGELAAEQLVAPA
jgi:coenzyme PQQ biosynthesis protein PqqD